MICQIVAMGFYVFPGLRLRLGAPPKVGSLAGKSTLLNLLAKLEEPCKGEVVPRRVVDSRGTLGKRLFKYDLMVIQW